MKHEKTVVVPETTRTYVEKVTCDLCGREIRAESLEIDEVRISHATGARFPEGGYSSSLEFDICSPCFDGVLLPFLREQGATPRVVEAEW